MSWKGSGRTLPLQVDETVWFGYTTAVSKQRLDRLVVWNGGWHRVALAQQVDRCGWSAG